MAETRALLLFLLPSESSYFKLEQQAFLLMNTLPKLTKMLATTRAKD